MTRVGLTPLKRTAVEPLHFAGAAKLQPPAGRKVLLLSAEPFLHTRLHHIGSVPDSDGDIMTQWNTMQHRMHPKYLHSIPIYDTIAQIPDITDPEIRNRFAGIIGTGGGAMVTDRPKWLLQYMDFLRTIPEAEMPTFLTCLSMQVFAEALGGKGTVKVNDSGERKFGVGKYKLTPAGKKHWAFSSVDNTFLAYKSHFQDVNPDKLPSGVEILAVDAQDGSIAALGIGEVLAIQFHTDLSWLAMIGLSQSRKDELLARGLTLEAFAQELRTADSIVMKTNRKINTNFNKRMHTLYK